MRAFGQWLIWISMLVMLLAFGYLIFGLVNRLLALLEEL